MKKLSMAIILTLPIYANATNYLQPSGSVSNSSAIQSQAQVQNNALQVQGATNGAISNDSGDVVSTIHYSNKRNPVNSAIAPAIDVNVICPVITVGGHAVQLIVAGISTTGKANVNSICMAYHLGQFDVVQNMLCNIDSEYKKANVNCK